MIIRSPMNSGFIPMITTFLMTGTGKTDKDDRPPVVNMQQEKPSGGMREKSRHDIIYEYLYNGPRSRFGEFSQCPDLPAA
jgi:hypothetical protein